jgi:hypothetical protein
LASQLQQEFLERPSLFGLVLVMPGRLLLALQGLVPPQHPLPEALVDFLPTVQLVFPMLALNP